MCLQLWRHRHPPAAWTPQLPEPPQRQHPSPDHAAARVCSGRVARVVAWLEALASDALDREADRAAEEGGALLAFAPDEGLPRETRSLLLTGAGSRPSQAPRGQEDTVTELDPDAVTRCCRLRGSPPCKLPSRRHARLLQGSLHVCDSKHTLLLGHA